MYAKFKYVYQKRHLWHPDDPVYVPGPNGVSFPVFPVIFIDQSCGAFTLQGLQWNRIPIGKVRIVCFFHSQPDSRYVCLIYMCPGVEWKGLDTTKSFLWDFISRLCNTALILWAEVFGWIKQQNRIKQKHSRNWSETVRSSSFFVPNPHSKWDKKTRNVNYCTKSK